MNATPAGQAWADQLAGWGVPEEILAQAPESPWAHDPAHFAVDDTLARDSASALAAREVLPPTGGWVLDVGCGGGRSSMALVPPAAHLVGVDENSRMLERFGAACAESGVTHAEILGRWPDVAPDVPTADVVVCHHVLYNVAEVEAFLVALTDHARLAVVVEIPTRHPQSAWNEAWAHFWGVVRPSGPTDADLMAVLRALGIVAEVWHSPRPPLARLMGDPAALVASSRRRLCLGADRDVELAAWLDEHPPHWTDTVVTLRWPGGAEGT